MNIFFCDLRGTFNGNEDNREEAIRRLVGNLSCLCKTLEIDKLLFGFVSTEPMESLMISINEMESSIKETSIKMTNSFSSHEKYYQGQVVEIPEHDKVSQICTMCADKKIKRVILADDTYLTHKMVRKVFNSLRQDIDFISLVPNTNKQYKESFTSEIYGIDGLNETIELYLDSMKKRRSL